jgi:hypothetical protein
VNTLSRSGNSEKLLVIRFKNHRNYLKLLTQNNFLFIEVDTVENSALELAKMATVLLFQYFTGHLSPKRSE